MENNQQQNNNIFTKTTDYTQNSINKAKGSFKNYVTTITLLMLLIFTVATSLGTLELKDGTSITFWINLAYLILSSVVSLCVMMPLGQDNERKLLTGYYENRKTWSKKTSDIFSNGNTTQFNNYCREYTLKLYKEKRESFVHKASISLEDFYKIFNDMTPNQLRDYYLECRKEEKRLKQSGELQVNDRIFISKMQYKLLLKTKKKIRIKPIIPTLILNNSKNKHEYSIGQKKSIPYSAKVISIRIISIIAYSIILVSVSVVPTGETGFAFFVVIVTRLFGVVTSALMGFMSGRTMTRNENADTLDRIAFISTFNEYIKNKTDVTKEQHNIKIKEEQEKIENKNENNVILLTNSINNNTI